jgi:predicted nucleic acid-binding protein
MLPWAEKPTPLGGGEVTLERSWKLQHRYQLSFWDALMVSAAKATGSGYLLTGDVQAGQELQGVKVLNRFLTEPASLGGC